MLTKITSIKKINLNSKRYDITVKDNHNFYANDILVHNCQNLKHYFEKYPDLEFEITEKLDGSSCTIYNKMNDPEVGVEHDFGVCSRNLDLKEDGNNSFWKVANKYKLKEILHYLNLNLAIQGELIGESIQKNLYNLKGQELRVFDIYDIEKRRHLTSEERLEVLEKINNCTCGHDEAILLGYEECTPILQHAPLLGTLKLKDFTFESLLSFAEDKSKLSDSQREGIVCKSKELINGQTISFKVISNF
jgi:RNA ligase (TIGR02306 family)